MRTIDGIDRTRARIGAPSPVTMLGQAAVHLVRSAAAGQSAFHLRFHVIPLRGYHDDRARAADPVTVEPLDESATLVRARP